MRLRLRLRRTRWLADPRRLVCPGGFRAPISCRERRRAYHPPGRRLVPPTWSQSGSPVSGAVHVPAVPPHSAGGMDHLLAARPLVARSLMALRVKMPRAKEDA